MLFLPNQPQSLYIHYPSEEESLRKQLHAPPPAQACRQSQHDYLHSMENYHRSALTQRILKGHFHEIWEFFNGYTLEEHRFEIHR